MARTKARARKTKKTKIKEEKEEESKEIENEDSIFSLDSLLEAREQENTELEKFPSSKSSSDVEEIATPFQKSEIKPLIERDNSVFVFNESSFPLKIISLIDTKERYDIHLTPQLTSLQWNLIKMQPNFVQPSQTLLFALIQELIVTSNREIGEKMLKYVETFPKESIEYIIWKDFLKEALISAQNVAIYIVAIATYNIFTKVGKEEETERNVQIILIFIATILSHQANSTNVFNKVVANFIEILESTLSFDSNNFEYIITHALELAHDQPFSNISYLISLFPLNKNGAIILGPIATNTALSLLNSEKEGIEGLSVDIEKIKSLCHSPLESDLLIASAVLALSERAIICAIKFKLINKEQLDMFVNGLTFNMVNATGQPTLMIHIKEQIHMTRTQIEMYSELCDE